MNRIVAEQNGERQLDFLAAQRQLYSAAKRILLVQITIAGPLVLLTTLIGFSFAPTKPYVALWGVLAALLDVVVLVPWQRFLRTQAARIQELFDCHVLDLPWNTLKVGDPPDPELVREQSKKYQSVSARMPPLTNWYGWENGRLPLYVARLLCQRANCWWDGKQRRRYALWVVIATVAIFLAVLAGGLIGGLTLEDFMLQVIAPTSPTFVVGIRQVLEQMDAAKRVDALKIHAEALWRASLEGRAVDDAGARSRELQDEIFESRKRSPLIPDAIYRFLQPGFEEEMRFGIEELVTQAEAQLGRDKDAKLP